MDIYQWFKKFPPLHTTLPVNISLLWAQVILHDLKIIQLYKHLTIYESIENIEFGDIYSALVNLLDNYRKFSIILRLKHAFKVWNEWILKIKCILDHILL